jgi:hypothetical protein
MKLTTLTRRTLLRTVLPTTVLAAPSVAYAAGSDAPSGNMVLAWRTNITPQWLDSQQHYRRATPNHFLNVVHDALIKNFRDGLYETAGLIKHL